MALLKITDTFESMIDTSKQYSLVVVVVVVAYAMLLFLVCRACILSHLQAHCACPVCNVVLSDFQPHLHLRYCVLSVSVF